MTFDTPDRWSSNDPECPFCGSLLKERDCRVCAVRTETEAKEYDTRSGAADYCPVWPRIIREKDEMNVNDAFPSKTLKAADLGNNLVTVTISHVEVESMGRGKDAETKPVVYFAGKSKGLVLNKTNSKRIQEITGSPETDHWKGHQITLYATETEFQGETVDCIRVKAPAGKNGGRPAPIQPPPPPPADDFQVSDDDVPF